MHLARTTSLGATPDAVNEALFFGQRVTKVDRGEAAVRIAPIRDEYTDDPFTAFELG